MTLPGFTGHRRTLLVGLLAVGTAAGLAACTPTASGGGAPSSAAPSSAVTGTTSAAPSTSASTSPSASTPAPTATSSAPASASSSVPNAPQTSPPPPRQRSTCRDLTIRVIRGSAAPGYEFAALQFQNSGSSNCTLVGVPTVTLRRDGQQVGTASRPSSAAASNRVFDLTPGATAESQLRDFTDCNAPLADEISVTAPTSSIKALRPGQLRPCRLVTYPLRPAQ